MKFATQISPLVNFLIRKCYIQHATILTLLKLILSIFVRSRSKKPVFLKNSFDGRLTMTIVSAKPRRQHFLLSISKKLQTENLKNGGLRIQIGCKLIIKYIHVKDWLKDTFTAHSELVPLLA